MSVFDGEIDYNSVYMVDYKQKKLPYTRTTLHPDDNCLIVGLSRDSLKSKQDEKKVPDVLCPLEKEYYKDARVRFKEDFPKLHKKYLEKDIDPTPIQHEIQDRGRTEYLVKYCSRELPFMSVNLARRARTLQTVRLPDDVDIPDTTQKNAFRHPPDYKYKERPSEMSMKPAYDKGLTEELRRILRVRTGESTYSIVHGLLGKVVLDENPFGKPREEPKYGRWRNPYYYSYQM